MKSNPVVFPFLFGVTLTDDMVDRVYSGRPGCMCGCRGKYSTYRPQVRKVLNMLLGHPDTMIEENVLHNDKIEDETGRNYVVYLNVEGGR